MNTPPLTHQQALSECVRLAAGCTGLMRCLKRIAADLPLDQFQRLALRHPDTVDRDLTWAHAEYKRFEQAYEAYCAEHHTPAGNSSRPIPQSLTP